jgi:hypothetical protein
LGHSCVDLYYDGIKRKGERGKEKKRENAGVSVHVTMYVIVIARVSEVKVLPVRMTKLYQTIAVDGHTIH